MASTRPNPYGMATPLGEGLSSVFNAFLSAPSPEDRAASALKIHGLQAQGKRDLAAAGYDESRTTGQNISNDALRSLPTLDYSTPGAQGTVMQTMDGNYGTLADVFATHQALQPGVKIESMDPIVYAKTGNAGNTFTGFREDQTGQMNRNTADNNRAIQTNTADNARAVEVEGMQQDGLNKRFSVNTPANTITTVPSNSPIADRSTNVTVEGLRTATGRGGSSTPKNYQTPDNKRGITYDGLTDAVTNQPLPQGTLLAGMAPGSYTEQQTKDASWALRLDGALSDWKDLSASFDPTSARDFLVQDARLPWTDLVVGNALISPERQQYQRAARDILAIFLRKDSGAAITPDEVATYSPMVLPMPFDDKNTLERKIDQINRMRAGLQTGGGAAYQGAQQLLQEPGFEMEVPFAEGGTDPNSPQPGQAFAPPTGGGLVVGTVEDGFQYLGGDPANPDSWAPVK